MGDVVSTPEGRLAALGIAGMLVLRAFAFAIGGTIALLAIAVCVLLLAVHKLVWLVGQTAFRLVDARRAAGASGGLTSGTSSGRDRARGDRGR
jgi:hypothetical protein